MNNQIRNKRKIYLCKRTIKDKRIVFSEPIVAWVNYQPVSDSAMGQILAYGENYIDRLILYMTKKRSKMFHNFDRCYVFREPPTPFNDLCSDADFFVDGEPTQYINESTVHLQRMTGGKDVR